MAKIKDDIDDETFVPLKDKKKVQSKQVSLLVMSLIVLGTGLFFSLLMILRTGGPFKFLFVALSLALGYLIYEAIKKYRSIN